MATTKTIQPTGETITIPAMADQPDMSVVATDLGNITDAVNAQNQALSNQKLLIGTITASTINAFMQSLVGVLDNLVTLSSLSIGTSLSGECVWSAHGYFSIEATIAHENYVNILMYRGNEAYLATAKFNGDIVLLNQLALKSDVTPVSVSSVIGVGSGITIDTLRCHTIGKICVLNARLVINSAITAGNATLLSNLPAAIAQTKIAVYVNNGNNKAAYIYTDGTLHDDWAGYAANTGIFINAVYVIS